jgi:hypothetical protein
VAGLAQRLLVAVCVVATIAVDVIYLVAIAVAGSAGVAITQQDVLA